MLYENVFVYKCPNCNGITKITYGEKKEDVEKMLFQPICDSCLEKYDKEYELVLLKIKKIKIDDSGDKTKIIDITIKEIEE